MVVLKRVLMKVVFPRPDSPATMMVKAAPRLATILWRWLGSCVRGQWLGMWCTDSFSVQVHTLAMPIGEAASAMVVTLVWLRELSGEMGESRVFRRALGVRLSWRLRSVESRMLAARSLSHVQRRQWVEDGDAGAWTGIALQKQFNAYRFRGLRGGSERQKGG